MTKKRRIENPGKRRVIGINTKILWLTEQQKGAILTTMQRLKTRRHKILFMHNSPFKKRIQRLRTQYSRKIKHRNRNTDGE